MQPVRGTKREKTRVSQVTIGFGFAPDWLKIEHVCSDWLELGKLHEILTNRRAKQNEI